MTVDGVSVVIPARNDAVLLADCLGALARQTVSPAEVVVVDNASTDDTAAVAAARGARVVHEPVVGIAPAAASGYDAARAEIIARLDADSRPPRDWVARLTRTLADDDRAAAITGAGVFYDLPRPLGVVAARGYLGAYHVLGYAAAANHVPWGSNMAFRRTVWVQVRDRVHRFDPEIHDDMDLGLALGTGHVIRRTPSIVVGVSARSLRGSAQLRRRLRRAVRTLALNWAGAPPWRRWAERTRAVRRRITRILRRGTRFCPLAWRE